jgi:hypothetical protein
LIPVSVSCDDRITKDTFDPKAYLHIASDNLVKDTAE